MKHIKTFEEKNKKYKVGDYIIVKDQSRPNCYVRIEEVNDGRAFDYMAIDYNFDNDQLSRYPIFEDEIIRKMTPDEIKNLKILRDTKKYNL